jgi:hypothetical protein
MNIRNILKTSAVVGLSLVVGLGVGIPIGRDLVFPDAVRQLNSGDMCDSRLLRPGIADITDLFPRRAEVTSQAHWIITPGSPNNSMGFCNVVTSDGTWQVDMRTYDGSSKEWQNELPTIPGRPADRESFSTDGVGVSWPNDAEVYSSCTVGAVKPTTVNLWISVTTTGSAAGGSARHRQTLVELAKAFTLDFRLQIMCNRL